MLQKRLAMPGSNVTMIKMMTSRVACRVSTVYLHSRFDLRWCWQSRWIHVSISSQFCSSKNHFVS